MKTCTLYNLPLEIADGAINSMKDLVIKAIKNDDYETVDDLLWNLRSMQESYDRAVNAKEDEE